MIAAVRTQPGVRSAVGSVGSTQHNMNCDRGFPQTILRYDGWTRSTNLARLWLYATVPLRALKLMAGAGYPNILVLEYALGGDAHIETLRSEEHTSELQSLMRKSYAVFCLKEKHQP